MNPGDFTLRSTQSRAAARRLLEQRQRSVERMEAILGCDWSDVPHATEWQEDSKDGVSGRVVSVPEGMRLADALRMIGGYTERELAEIAAAQPEPVEIGSFYAIQR